MIDPARALRMDRGKTVLAQHAQMQRDRGLGDAEFALDHLDHFAGGVLVIGQKIEDAAPHRIAQDIECVQVSGSL